MIDMVKAARKLAPEEARVLSDLMAVAGVAFMVAHECEEYGGIRPVTFGLLRALLDALSESEAATLTEMVA